MSALIERFSCGVSALEARFYEVLSQYLGEAPAPQESPAAIRRVDCDAEPATLTAEFTNRLAAIFASIEATARRSDWALLETLLHTLQ